MENELDVYTVPLPPGVKIDDLDEDNMDDMVRMRQALLEDINHQRMQYYQPPKYFKPSYNVWTEEEKQQKKT